MDKNIILKELARKLPETEGISYELQNDKLKVKVGEDNEFEVRPSGGITCYPETVYDDKFHEAEILISNTVRDIKEYVDIMQTAPELKAEGIGEGFKKIIDFNNTVLAGRYLNDNDGFQFVTWMYDRTGVCAGHYYNDDFEKAKESFAKRSGFINPNKLFSDEELSEIYRCISDTLYGGFDLDDEQHDMLEDIQEKIGNDTGSMEYSVQDIDTEAGEIQEEKVFTDVALTAGKTMTSEVAEDIETPDVQLFVEQNEEITKEILTDGSEKDVKIVSFETNGGSEIRDISVEPGSTLPQIDAPKKEGYNFAGWYIDDEFNTTFDYESGIIENITLYAKYTPAFDVFAKIADMTYDGEDLVIPVNFDYNHIDTAPWLAIYESGKLLKLQKCEIPAETSETDIEVSIPGLNGLYDVKMLFFSDMDTLRPLSSCAYNTLFAY